jgi:hypothetical protein
MSDVLGSRRSIRLIPAVLGALALLGPNAAEAGGAGCRRMPFVAAECFNAGDTPHCARRHVVADPCFFVHARLTFANGAPTVRLWPVGTRRLLGVFGGGDGDAASPTLLPPAVVSVAMPAAPGSMRAVVGDFRVCPLATQRPGWMRPVCLESATHVVLSWRQSGVFDRSPP